jgi:molybdopterin synthase sulfur carrier subunit
MKVQVFALLKEYFDSQFEIETPPANISALKDQLGNLNPQAREVLKISRFVVQDEFVDSDYLLTESDTVFVIPPSSGG